MKKILVCVVFTIVTVFYGNSTTYQSINGGSWNNVNTWQFGNIPNLGNNDIINIGYFNPILDNHNIVLNGNLNGNNDINLNIFPGDSLIINGNLTIKQRFTINVYDGGYFYISGDVTINATNINQGAQLIINGYAHIGGDLNGIGSVVGVGTLVVDGVIGIGIVDFGPLPVELLYFDVKYSDNCFVFNWATSSEINNSHFLLELYYNGVWNQITMVNGNGTTSSLNVYNFIYSTDVIYGVYYFRLSQYDFDGGFVKYEPVVLHVDIDDKFMFNVINKTKEIMLIEPNNNENYELKIYDVNGKVVDIFFGSGNYEYF